MGWRYIAQELPSGRIIDPELPLTGVSITDAVSAPRSLSGSLGVEVPRLRATQGDGALLKEWGSAIWAEEDGEIRGGGIVDSISWTGASWSVECRGFSGYVQGLPYTGSGWVGVKVDPLDVVREIWRHAQSQPGGNLGVILDSTTSPLRIGEEEYVPLDGYRNPSDTTFDDGPIRLNWWDTTDMGEMQDKLAAEHFDYTEESAWAPDGESFVHRLRLHYPRRGRRRTDLRFVVGENIARVPSIAPVEEGYANVVQFLGAGEGRNKIRSVVGQDPKRLRRVATIMDDTVRRQDEANRKAREEHAKRVGLIEVTEAQIADHPHAPIGSWVCGDEIRIQGEMGWGSIDQWARVMEQTITPGDTASAVVKLKRVV